MQYLKDEIKYSILQAALNEFDEKGFNDASMREIAGNAGIATGNIYRYFGGKDDLFQAIMAPVYERFTELIFTEFAADDHNTPVLEDIVDKIMNFYEAFSREFMILLDKSQGSSYQGIKEDLILLIEKRLKAELLPKLEGTGAMIDGYIFYVMASMLVEGVFTILRECKEDRKRIKRLMGQMLALNLHYLEIMTVNPSFRP